MPSVSNPTAAGESDRVHAGQGATRETGQSLRELENSIRKRTGSQSREEPMWSLPTGKRMDQSPSATDISSRQQQKVRFPQLTDKALHTKCKNPGHCHQDMTIPSLSTVTTRSSEFLSPSVLPDAICETAQSGAG